MPTVLEHPRPLERARRHLRAGRPEAALALLARGRDDARRFDLMGQALEALGRPEAALAAYRQGLACRQVPASLHNNLGDLCRRLGRLEEAQRHLGEAVRALPRPRVFSNYALLQQALGRRDLARAYLTLACQLAPGDARLRWNLALLQLAGGDLEHGWRGYEAGLACGLRRPTPHPAPRWDGEPVACLRVTAEQGLGDEILFATCLADARARCDRLLWEADPRLIPLLRRAHPGVDYLPRGAAGDDGAGAHCPQGHLPGLFRPRLDAFPRHPTLAADPRRTARWRQRLAALGPGLKVGISWLGGSGWERRRRSPPVDAWLGLLGLPNVVWVDVQYGEAPGREQFLAAGLHRFPDLDARDDLEELAALLCALDLTVSVSNATAHLGGALGAAVWTVLPVDHGWRWFGGEASPWYPRMRLFRQSRPGAWSEPLATVRAALSAGS